MTPEAALVDITARLTRLGVAHALVGGLAISIRAEVRFTRDVDLAIAVESDADVERLARSLAAEGFALVAVVEQDEKKRIAIARTEPRREARCAARRTDGLTATPPTLDLKAWQPTAKAPTYSVTSGGGAGFYVEAAMCHVDDRRSRSAHGRPGSRERPDAAGGPVPDS